MHIGPKGPSKASSTNSIPGNVMLLFYYNPFSFKQCLMLLYVKCSYSTTHNSKNVATCMICTVNPSMAFPKHWSSCLRRSQIWLQAGPSGVNWFWIVPSPTGCVEEEDVTDVCWYSVGIRVITSGVCVGVFSMVARPQSRFINWPIGGASDAFVDIFLCGGRSRCLSLALFIKLSDITSDATGWSLSHGGGSVKVIAIPASGDGAL